MGKRGRDNWPMMPIRWLRESACHNATGFGFREKRQNPQRQIQSFKFIDTVTVMMAFLAAGGLEAVKPESLQTSKPVQPLEL